MSFGHGIRPLRTPELLNVRECADNRGRGESLGYRPLYVFSGGEARAEGGNQYVGPCLKVRAG
jgi:hypothetical protein